MSNYLYELIYSALLHDIGKIKNRVKKRGFHEKHSVEFLSLYADMFKKIGTRFDVIEKLVLCHHISRRDRRGREELHICSSLSDEEQSLLGTLREGDHKAAPDRITRENPLGSGEGSKKLLKLVSPLWVKNYYDLTKNNDKPINIEDYAENIIANSRICYNPVPLTVLSKYGSGVSTIINSYQASQCTDEQYLNEYYRLILRDLEDKFDRLRELVIHDYMDKDTVLASLINYIRYSLLLVPDDVYNTLFPDTSLAVHLILSSALASSFYIGGSDKIRVALLDLSGIQNYIASYAKTSGALRQIRGRSLLLQLVMRASAEYILDRLGLPPVHLILLRGDNALFILPEKINDEDSGKLFLDAAREIEESIYRIFHGDIYVAAAVSEPFTPLYSMPWKPDFGEKGFSKAFIELGEKLSLDKMRKFSRISSSLSEHVSLDDDDQKSVDECELCRATLYKDKLVDIRKYGKACGLDYLDAEKACLACLFSHIAGYAAENLSFIIEINDKEVTDKIFDDLVSGKPPTWLKDFGIIPLKGLNRTYILVSFRENNVEEYGGKNVDEEWRRLYSFLEEIVKDEAIKTYFSGMKTIRITIMKINDPFNTIPKHEYSTAKLYSTIDNNIRIVYSFTTLFTNFTMGGTNDLSELAKINDEKETYLSWIKIDIDRMGENGLYLIGSISRYTTLSELVNFFTNMLGYELLKQKSKRLDGGEEGIWRKSIVVFSGGDDTLIISRFVEGLYYLYYYHDWFKRFFGEISGKEPLTVSAGMFVSEADYPSYLAYKEALRLLEKAKDEGRNRISTSILDLHVPSAKDTVSSKQPKKTLEWDKFKNIILLSTDTTVTSFVKEHKVLAFKIASLMENISAASYGILNSIASGSPIRREQYRELAEKIVAYTYVYKKFEKTSTGGSSLKQVLDTITNKLGVGDATPKNLIDLMVKNKIDEILLITSSVYRALSLILLRIKENI